MSKPTDTRSDNIRSGDIRSDEERHDDDRNDGTKSPERLEREVDQARARLGRTASELSDRLSPGELFEQALGMAREHGGEFGRNLGAQVKHNPMPLILTSVGISWMMMSSAKSGAAHDHEPYNTSIDTASTDTAGSSFMDSLGDTAAKTRDRAAAVGDRMHGATANVKVSAQNARESLVHFYRDQPLLAGSLGIAIGAALGALVPPSEMEDNMLGEASDRSVDVAKARAAEAYDEVRESARSE
jgi:hypothetical protein